MYESSRLGYWDGDLETYIEEEKKPAFNKLLLAYIDQQGLEDAFVYKKAGLDRRHFSKIRSREDYCPKKSTVFALALALELAIEDVEKLLAAAGYSFSKSEVSDLIVLFFLERNIYDLLMINEALVHFKEEPLAGALS